MEGQTTTWLLALEALEQFGFGCRGSRFRGLEVKVAPLGLQRRCCRGSRVRESLIGGLGFIFKGLYVLRVLVWAKVL